MEDERLKVIIYLFYSTCVSILPMYRGINYIYIWFQWVLEGVIIGTGVTDGSEPPNEECWEPTQQVLSTTN